MPEQPRILLTNDDGVDSPTLLPLWRALRRWADVDVVVPAVERSWIAKAISRFTPLRLWRERRAEEEWIVVDGLPADCVNLAIHSLGLPRPSLVVSGVNLGLNFGSAFVLSSGTVGAALESSIAGVPAIAFSMAVPNDAYGLSGPARLAALGTRVEHASEVASELASILYRHGMPAAVDAFSVNMPADVTMKTPRRVGRVARTRYGPLFVSTGEAEFRHRFSYLESLDGSAETDVEFVSRGLVAITPLRLELSASVPDTLRQAWERTS